MIYSCLRRGLRQTLLVGDLEDAKDCERLRSLLPDSVRLVLSVPPWTAETARYWRSKAGAAPKTSYEGVVTAFVGAVFTCLDRGCEHVVIEYPHVPPADLWSPLTSRLPLLEQWPVFYGTPGRTARSGEPNLLLHYGRDKLATDPSLMTSEPMYIRACAGLRLPPGSWVLDPFMGIGMTSRLAHYFGWNCLGMEIDPKRLEVAAGWLKKQGYVISCAD